MKNAAAMGQPSGAALSCLVCHPLLGPSGKRSQASADRLNEAVRLAQAIDLHILQAEVTTIVRPHPETLFRGGVLDRLGTAIAGRKIQIAVVDGPLSSIQQRNLERAWSRKVIDRTGLILEIFGARARTGEGRLQVELAALSYQRGRLVRSWTHLERQRGGFGFMGGPGECQIEADRRQIDTRIVKPKKDLDQVRRTRQLHRQARRRVPYPVVALVGYTNSGKSTLFSRLTRAEVSAKDQLFATLDPTMRGMELGGGRTVILSDTVGSVSDLPHDLVASFHATLEEVLEADFLVHVRDIAHPESEAQKADVDKVLEELGLEEDNRAPLIEVLNKIDLLDEDDAQELANRAKRGNLPRILASAGSGEGCEDLLGAIAHILDQARWTMDISLAWKESAEIAWLYQHGQVLERHDGEEQIRLKMRLDETDAPRFKARRAQREARSPRAEAQK